MAAFESKKFSYRSGYSYKVPAETVGKALESIEERDGKVTGKSFLDYSRPEDSDTHSMFEWNDAIAAEKYRLRQATQIINQLEVQIVYESTGEVREEPITISAYVNVNSKGTKEKGSFIRVETAIEKPDMWAVVVANARGELRAFQRKYERYAEFAGVCAEINKFLEETENESICENRDNNIPCTDPAGRIST